MNMDTWLVLLELFATQSDMLQTGYSSISRLAVSPSCFSILSQGLPQLMLNDMTRSFLYFMIHVATELPTASCLDTSVAMADS